MSDFRVRLADWSNDREAVSEVRRLVFIQEQKVPPELEWDEADAGCVQLLAISQRGEPIGTGRLLPGGQIGRMAVLKAWRGRGVGAALLQLALVTARQRGDREAFLHAQTAAIPFYQRFGFVAEGEQYLEAGITHQNMRLIFPA